MNAVCDYCISWMSLVPYSHSKPLSVLNQNALLLLSRYSLPDVTCSQSQCQGCPLVISMLVEGRNVKYTPFIVKMISQFQHWKEKDGSKVR